MNQELSLATVRESLGFQPQGGCQKDMILKGDNWRAVFEAGFGNRIEVEAHFMQVQRVRVAIAHPRPLSDNEYLFFTASAKWLQIAINRALGKGLS